MEPDRILGGAVRHFSGRGCTFAERLAMAGTGSTPMHAGTYCMLSDWCVATCGFVVHVGRSSPWRSQKVCRRLWFTTSRAQCPDCSHHFPVLCGLTHRWDEGEEHRFCERCNDRRAELAIEARLERLERLFGEDAIHSD